MIKRERIYQRTASKEQKNYIKTGIIEKKYSDIITRASTIRNASDYDDFYIASKEESRQQIDEAKDLLDAVKRYLSEIE